MSTNQEIMNKLKSIQAKIESLEQEANELVAGRKARIISDYNGQPYGHSKFSMKGKIIKINNIVFDGYFTCFSGEGLRVGISFSDIEFID